MGESKQHNPLRSVVVGAGRTRIIIEDIRRQTSKRMPAVDEVRLTVVVGGDFGGVLAHLDSTQRRELIAALQAFDGAS